MRTYIKEWVTYKIKIWWTNIFTVMAFMVSAFPFTSIAENATGIVIINATLVSDCNLSLIPSVLDLGSIPVSKLQGKAKNSALEGMNGIVTVTSTCAGTNRAKLNIKAQGEVSDGYILSEADVLRFGLKINGTLEPFDDITKSVIHEIESDDLSTGYKQQLEFYAAVGGAAFAKAGTYKSTVDIKLEPE